MSKIISRLLNIFKKTFHTVKYLKEVYKHGGYSTFNISNINHGEILKGKKVLITGGSSGIGLSIARKCINEGAKVVITGRRESKLEKVINEIGNPLLKSQIWDISDISKIEQGIKETKLLLDGDIDILVNNAGVLDGVNFPNIKEEAWDNTYNTNSKGLFFLTQALSKEWIEIKGRTNKKILNISSQGGFVGAIYPYRMTKWDVAGLTQGLGIKLAPYGIIVNGIAPGIINTDMQSGLLSQRKNDNIYCNLTPLKRFALPTEIAELAIFLLSDSGSFIVGQTIVSDGGFSIK